MPRLAIFLYILLTGAALGQTWNTIAEQLDTAGNRIHQFEGCVMYDPQSLAWYKYGTNFDSGGSTGLYVYKSVDFVNWQPVASYGYIGFRMTVLYNALNKNYVLWAGSSTPNNGKSSFVSSSPAGPFTRVNSYDSWQGTNIDVGDCSAYLDTNTGIGYFITECSGNSAFMSVQLSPDFQSLTSTYTLTTNSDGESPTIWSNGPGSYFLMESFQTGWGPNENEYHWSSSPLGPWESFQYGGINPFQTAGIPQTPGEIAAGITATADNAYDTQTCQVLNVNGQELYFGDRYDNWSNTGATFPNYRRIVLPISQGGKTFTINWQPTWTLTMVPPGGTPTPSPTPTPTPAPTPATPHLGPPAGYIQDFNSNWDASLHGGIIDWTGLQPYNLSNWSLPRFSSQQPDDRGDAGAAVYIDGAGDDPSGQPSPFQFNWGSLYINTWYASGKWNTGMISTVDTNGNGFSAIGGYWEAKIQVPAVNGKWPAFWLYDLNTIQRANRTTNAIEIDIFEGYGSSPTGDNQLVHLWSPTGVELNTGPHNTFQLGGWNGMSSWHVYGCLVNTDLIHYYVDGIDVFDTPAPAEIATHPLYAMIDAALQYGLPTNTTQPMIVSYLFHWKAPTGN